MQRPKQEDYVYYQGEKFQVEFYFSPKGDMPAKECHDASPIEAQWKLLALAKHIAEEGRLFDESKFRMVDKKERIFEFKPKAQRFFNFFYEDSKIILTNGYRKKGQKVDKKELAKAIRLKKDYEARVKGACYYE